MIKTETLPKWIKLEREDNAGGGEVWINVGLIQEISEGDKPNEIHVLMAAQDCGINYKFPFDEVPELLKNTLQG